MPSTNDRLDGKWWIKWWTRETLHGSFMTAPLDELGFFLKLCCLAKQLDPNDEGYIRQTDGSGLSHSSIAGLLQLHSDMVNFERLLQSQKDKGRIVEDNTGAILIVNYKAFQKTKGQKLADNFKRNQRNKTTPETQEARDKYAVEKILDYDPKYIAEALSKRGLKIKDDKVVTNDGEEIE